MSIANLLSGNVKSTQNLKCTSIETASSINKDWAEYNDQDWDAGFTTTTPSGRVNISMATVPLVQPMTTEITTMTNSHITDNSVVLFCPLPENQGTLEVYYACTFGTLAVSQGEVIFGLANVNMSGGGLTGSTFTFDYFIINSI